MVAQTAFRRMYLLMGVCAILTTLLGCSSTNPKGLGSHAAVTINGYSVTDVVLTTRGVFTDHGFTLSKAEQDRMIFERPGSRSEQLKYGSFGSPDVVIRVKVDLQEVGPENFFLRCDVFSVRDAGDSVLEDETKLLMLSAKHYQEIMDEIPKRLAAQ